jgi:hypothetical protein
MPEECKASIDATMKSEQTKIQQINTLVYTACMLHSHKGMMSPSQAQTAEDLADTCMGAATLMAKTNLEVE